MGITDRPAIVAERYVSEGSYAGIEWLVTGPNGDLSRGARGYADASMKTPIPDGAIYRIYSMTKPIVSVLALMMMEQGKLRLFDPISSFDSAFDSPRVLHADGTLEPAARPITVEDLMTHRAGYTYEFITGCHIAPLYKDASITNDATVSLEEMAHNIADLPLAFQPGAAFRYSVAVDVLAHIIERTADRSLDELLQELIFKPLGMGDTAFSVPADKLHRLMPMYGESDLGNLGRLDPQPHRLIEVDIGSSYPTGNTTTFRRGGHGLYSTLHDYARFARMLLTGRSDDGARILSRKTVELMRYNRIPPDLLPLSIGMNVLAGYGWGLGVRVMIDPGQSKSLTGMGELGWAGAASTYFWVDPLEQMTGVVMTQYLGAALPMSDDMRVAAYTMVD